MNKLMSRSIYLISGSAIVAGFALFGSHLFASQTSLHVKSNSKGELLCYKVNANGQRQDLDRLCKPSETMTNQNSSDSDKAKIAIIKQGRNLIWEKKYPEAISVFTQAINTYPNDGDVYVGRAWAKFGLGLAGGGVTDFSNAVTDFSNAEEAYRKRGQSNKAENMAKLIKQVQRGKLGIQ